MTDIKTIIGELTGIKYKPGLRFEYIIAIPAVDTEEYALLVEHDGQNNGNVYSLLALADEGKAPYCISLGVMPGKLIMPDGTVRDMRMNNYDIFDREYGDFLVYELIPYVMEKYNLRISSSADMHMISGGSSGGISALSVAWFHPDYFHRVHMSSPSFLAMGRGNEFPYLLRKYETKPLRIYHEFSENEPNDYFGWSRAIDMEADKGLIFSGYDYRSKLLEGEGHSSRYGDKDEGYLRNEWLWQDYRTNPIVARANSPRVDKVIPFGSKWEKCNTFPENVSDIPKKLESCTCVTLSKDKLTWYAADRTDDLVYKHLADESVSYEKRYVHTALHTIPRIYPKGAISMTTDAVDRLYVLTAIGIQCVRSFGLIDVILDLPDDSSPLDIAITDHLYVKTEKGAYRRKLQGECTDFKNIQRKYTSYFD